MYSGRKINIFISYSHLNEEDKVRFVKFLKPVDIVNLDIWVDDEIGAGNEFAPEIISAIERADIAVLLVSVDFLNSNFIKSKEIPQILEKQAEQTLKVFPVIIRSSSWKNVEWLAKRNVRPKDGKPIFESRNVDKELEKITDEIVVLAKSILEKESISKVFQNNENKPLSNFSKPENNASQNISQPTILPFANRVYILNTLDPKETKDVFKNFVAIDGPAGRGKTELLKELYRRYKSANWDCAFGTIILDETKTKGNRESFVNQLAESLEIKNWVPKGNDYGDLGGQLFVKYENSKSNIDLESTGLAFFVDWDGEIEPNELSEFIDGFAVRIREKAQENNFFATNQRKLLFVIAGRYLLSFEALSRSKLAFQRFSLLPFVYEDVQDVLYKYLNEIQNSSKVRLLAPFVLFLSGGHPGLMAKIVSQYEKENHYSIPHFVAKYIKDKWEMDLDSVVKEITKEVFEKNPELLDIAKEFCVYRYFNKSIAETILNKLDFTESQKQEYKLSIMKSHGLYQYEGSLYRDGLVSTLLALSLSVEDNQKFIKQCNNAKDLCLQEMKDDYLHDKWFLEYLYISLFQQSVDTEQSLVARDRAQESFRVDLEHLLTALKSLSDEKKERTAALFNLIEQELNAYKMGNDPVKANFRFFVNYILGEVTYTDTYFEEDFIPKILADIKVVLGLGD